MSIINGIETDINVRWENDTDHHPESIAAIKALAELDFLFGGDRFQIKTGGDGDDGESMMYLLDIFYENRDAGGDFNNIMKIGSAAKHAAYDAKQLREHLARKAIQDSKK